MDPRRDNGIWGKVRVAFRDELRPDTPSPETLTYAYKYIKRVGVLNNSALVFIGYKTREHPERDEIGAEYFSAFNYDLSKGSTSKVVDPENGQPLAMWQWKFVKLGRFEPSIAPDVIFKYMTCWECEPEGMLSALRYDSALRKWQLRHWGNGKPLWWMTATGLVVDVDVYGGDDTISYDCLYGLLHLTKDGLDNIAIRCREIREPTKDKFQINDSTVLYSFNNGHFGGEVVNSKDQRLVIWSELCRLTKANKLCKDVASSR